MAKFFNLLIIVFVFTITNPNTTLGQEMNEKEENIAIGFRTVHLISIKNVEDESEFVTIADDFNKVVSKLGYQNVRYNFWKETGDRDGQYKYIFESNWPDKKTYDKVHEHK